MHKNDKYPAAGENRHEKMSLQLTLRLYLRSADDLQMLVLMLPVLSNLPSP